MPESRIARTLRLAEAEARRATGGQLASYIPELAHVDPDLFALAACTVDGQQLAVGDVAAEVTIQSVSKPFLYAAALERLGAEVVHARVGAEPTGDSFDSILRLDDRQRPHNPMVNAGALAVTGLFLDDGPLAPLAVLSRFAGRELPGIDEAVRRSELETSFRNRAIVHLLRHHRCLPEDPERVLDLYVRQCAVRVTAQDLAAMAATLAAGGRSPLTGERVLAPHLVEPVLTVMSTCGMYDHAGWFAVRVGLPAKSGVSGGILVVAPGRMGLAALSPLLDDRGTSVRGLVALEHIARDLDLHGFSAPGTTSGDAPARTEFESLARGAEGILAEMAALPDVPPAAYLPLGETGVAIALSGLDGREAAMGEADRRVSLQSAGNPFLYALVATAVGADVIHAKVGLEPAGHPFDSIRLGPDGRPSNPFDNAGAITVAALAPGATRAERIEGVRARFGELIGCPDVAIDPEVLAAERRCGDRNRAIASLLRGLGLVDDPVEALEVYFALCSLSVSCRDLARAASTLARGGTDPGGRRLLDAAVARDTVSLMWICGLHDESGRFAFEVGLPAKSGISGLLVAVVPGLCGLAIRSPGVDDHGTSVRSRWALRRLSRQSGLGIHAHVEEDGQTVPSPWEGDLG